MAQKIKIILNTKTGLRRYHINRTSLSRYLDTKIYLITKIKYQGKLRNVYTKKPPAPPPIKSWLITFYAREKYMEGNHKIDLIVTYEKTFDHVPTNRDIEEMRQKLYDKIGNDFSYAIADDMVYGEEIEINEDKDIHAEHNIKQEETKETYVDQITAKLRGQRYEFSGDK